MENVSIEYCHIYVGGNNKVEIEAANYWAPRMLKMFEGDNVQTCIMIDDIHKEKVVTDEFVQSIVDQLEVKPNCVYLESRFIQEAHRVVDAIDPKERDFIHSDERTWLRENVEKYRTSTEFLLQWKNNKGEVKFSCPTLAAASYLVRLGYVDVDTVNAVYGEELMKADRVVNILSSEYLQVEDKAQSIIEATHKDALRKVSWFLY